VRAIEQDQDDMHLCDLLHDQDHVHLRDFALSPNTGWLGEEAARVKLSCSATESTCAVEATDSERVR